MHQAIKIRGPTLSQNLRYHNHNEKDCIRSARGQNVHEQQGVWARALWIQSVELSRELLGAMGIVQGIGGRCRVGANCDVAAIWRDLRCSERLLR